MIVLQAVADGRLGGGTTHVLQLIEALRADLPCEVHLVSAGGLAGAGRSRPARRGRAMASTSFERGSIRASGCAWARWSGACDRP